MTNWTESQLEAIHAETTKNILVSASAGSGKTAVMTQRIIEKVKKGISISSLFVSTFTIKAAAELRSRIEQQLKEEFYNETDRNTQKKLTVALQELPLATIGTMDAFANQLLKKYYYLIHVDPNFRVLTDKSEQDIFKKDVFENLVEKYLSEGIDKVTIDEFKECLKNFSSGKTIDGFREVVYKVYDFSQATENPLKFLEENFLSAVKKYQTYKDLPSDFTKTVKQDLEEIYIALHEVVSELTAKTKEKAEIVLDNEDAILSYLDKKEYTDFCEFFLSDDIFSRWTIKNSDFKSLFDEKIGTKSAPGSIRKFIEKIKYQDFIEKNSPEIGKNATVLRDFSIDFYLAYFEKKQSENAYEFSDIAHLAIEILEKHEDVRAEVQKSYSEVMIDEYQDTSHTQEKMLTLISSHHNIFMVGDIKQSIYGFRLADPELFNQKFQEYQKKNSEGQLIRLAENFRSSKEILNFTNDVFRRLMDKEIYKVEYKKEDELVYGSKDALQLPEGIDTHPELLLYLSESENEDTDEDSPSLSKNEIRLAAEKIIDLINKGVRPDEIVLLVRGKSNNNVIEDIFKSLNIPIVLDEGRVDYLKSIEVQVILDTLRTINNPLFDLPLVAVMRSPLFAFNEDELARISLQLGSEQPFWKKIEQSVSTDRDELIGSQFYSKLTAFINKLTEWRQLSSTIALHDLLWKIYVETDYHHYVSKLPNGEQREANLFALLTRAENYEKNGYKGLIKFIDLIDNFLSQNNDLESIAVKLPQNAVRVMTIHKAKGLQFDYVFLMNLQTKFNQKDLQQNILLDREKGAGIRGVKDIAKEISSEFPYMPVKFDSLAFTVNQEVKEKELLAEEMRLLYVAFTRASKKLYMVGKLPNIKKIESYDDVSTAGILLDKYRRKASDGFLGWLLALNQGENNALSSLFIPEPRSGKIEVKGLDLNTIKKSDGDNEEQVKKVKFNLEDYAYQEATKLPSTQSPSLMKKRYERLLQDETRETLDINQKFELNLSTNKKEYGAVEKGTAVHAFMQAIDFSAISLTALQHTLDSLQLPRKLEATIDVEKIMTFFDTELGKLLRENADEIVREAPFSMLKKDEVSQEQFVVRGIVDGYLVLADRVVLFDYKTDYYKTPEDLIPRYQMQMDTYASALERGYGKPVEKYLVLLGNEKKVEIVKL